MKKTFKIRNSFISYHEHGEGTFPVLFVHSNSSSHLIFKSQLDPLLTKNYRFILMDLPGHGESGRFQIENYRIKALADIVSEFATNIGCDKGAFVGSSLGGHILFQVMSSLKTAAGFLAFGAPPLGNPPAFDKAFFPSKAAELFFKEQLTDNEIQIWADHCFDAQSQVPSHFFSDIRGTDPRLRSSLHASLASLDYKDELVALKELKQPIAIFHGALERTINLKYFETISIPTLWKKTVHIIEGCSHNPQAEKPQKFNQMLKDFLSEISI